MGLQTINCAMATGTSPTVYPFFKRNLWACVKTVPVFVQPVCSASKQKRRLGQQKESAHTPHNRMLLSACDMCSFFTCSGKVWLAAAEVAAWTMLTVRCHTLVVLSFGHFSKRVPFCQTGDRHQRTAHSAEVFRGRCWHSCIAPSISALKLNCLCVLRSTFTVTPVTASW